MSDLFYQSSAVIEGPYRYRLERVWDEALRPCVFVMLNPSKADAVEDDPTIRRCLHYARREGCGSLVVVNLFALRATDPKELRRVADPIGPDNDAHISAAVEGDALIIAAWGAHGDYLGRDRAVLALLAGKAVRCLGKTGSGHPRHPVRLRNDQPLSPATPPG